MGGQRGVRKRDGEAMPMEGRAVRYKSWDGEAIEEGTERQWRDREATEGQRGNRGTEKQRKDRDAMEGQRSNGGTERHKRLLRHGNPHEDFDLRKFIRH